MMRRLRGIRAALPWRNGKQRALVAAFLLVRVAVVAAQSPTITAVKAAFIYNFASFADWPADKLAPRQRLLLCVIGDDAVAEALSRTIQGLTIGGHELSVEVIKPEGKIRDCHLLYTSGSDSARTTKLLVALKDAWVLTVSDGDQFAQSGGIAQLILENGRMRFAINAAAADRARIHLSSKLLNLARMVTDGQDVPR